MAESERHDVVEDDPLIGNAEWIKYENWNEESGGERDFTQALLAFALRAISAPLRLCKFAVAAHAASLANL